MANHPEGWEFRVYITDYPQIPADELARTTSLLFSGESKVISASSRFAESREVSAMSLYYNITEYSTAIKPWIFADILAGEKAVSATYIDPDIQFFESLPGAELLGQEVDCIVTPHILTDSLNALQQPTLQNIRSCGSYNFGFVHFQNTIRARRVIDFWRRQLVYDALISFEDNLFTDQRFGDLFPSLCATHISHNPGLNVAYWNLQERLVHRPNLHRRPYVRLIGERTMQGDDWPLVFFHFSALRSHGSIGISKHGGQRPRYARGSNKTIERLIEDYESTIETHRQSVKRLCNSHNPSLIGSLCVETGDGGKIYRLTEQQRRTLNRYLRDRASIGTSCLPPSRFINEAEFLQSLHGLPSHSDSRIIQSALNVFGAIGLQIPGLNLRGDTTLKPAIDPVQRAALNIVGYPNFSFGIGKITALILEGLAQAEIGISFTVDPANAKSILQHDLAWVKSLPNLSEFNPLAPTLFLINADQLLHYIKAGIALHCFSRTCNIGYWWWELEKPVPAHADAARFLDIVMAPTRFIFDSLADAVPAEKLIYAPLDYKGLFSSLRPDKSIIARDHLRGRGGDPQDFVFSLGLDLTLKDYESLTLMVFDFHSCVERKNPWAAIEAFGGHDLANHALIIKCSGGAAMAEQYIQLIDLVSSQPNVYLLDRRLSEADLSRLFRICQVYVSPHRAEGLGLNIIEADACGLATVTTNYGGILDYPFYGEGPHYRIAYHKQAISLKSLVYQPYLKGMGETVTWAEPDPEDLKAKLIEAISIATGKGAAPARDIQSEQLNQSETITTILRDLLASGISGPAAYMPTLPKDNRAPAAIAVVPTLPEAKRQLYASIKQVYLSGKSLFFSLKHFANVCRLIVWLLMRRGVSLRRLMRATATRGRARLRASISRSKP